MYIGQSDNFKNVTESAECRRQRLFQLRQFNFFVDVVDVNCLTWLPCSCEICACDRIFHWSALRTKRDEPTRKDK